MHHFPITNVARCENHTKQIYCEGKKMQFLILKQEALLLFTELLTQAYCHVVAVLYIRFIHTEI